MITELPVERYPELVPMALDFYTSAKLPGKIDVGLFVGTIAKLAVGGMVKVFSAEDNGTLTGAIGVFVSPDLFTGESVAQEMFWFVTPSARGGMTAVRLLDAAEKAAARMGAVRLMMAHTAELTPEKLRDFYLHRGYTPRETYYQRNLA